MNLVALAGRLTAEPELCYTEKGVPYCRAVLAVDRDYKTPDGSRKTDFIEFICWNQTAEFLVRYFSKGSMVLLQGRLEVQKYEKDGQKRIAYSVRAEKIGFGGDYRKYTGKPAQDKPIADDIEYPDFLRDDYEEIQ